MSVQDTKSKCGTLSLLGKGIKTLQQASRLKRWRGRRARSPNVCIWLDIFFFFFLQLHSRKAMSWSSLLFTLFWAAWFWFLPLHPLHTHTSYLFINSLSLLSKWKQWIIFLQVIELKQVTEGSNQCQNLWGKKNGSRILLEASLQIVSQQFR